MGRKKGLRKPGSVPEIRVGDIFYASWGYDQTNIDFVQVVSVSPTGKTVMCRMMGNKRVGDGWNVVPSTAQGETFRLHVRSKDRLVGSYPFARGATRQGYFFRWERKPVYETPPGFGH